MTGDKSPETKSPETQRIGLLVVHGIGQQQRFETAAALARSLAGPLVTRDKTAPFALLDRSDARAAEELDCPSPHAGDSPYEIEFRHVSGATTHVHIHEVWWAGIGASDSLLDQLQFWTWALGQWFAPIVLVSGAGAGKSNTDDLMVGPKFADQNTPEDYAPGLRIFWVRLRLFLWGMAAFLTFFTWNLLKMVLSAVSPYLGSPSLIIDYVRHVQIYTQSPPVGGGGLSDIGQPWRATIRRRMIAELVAMAERGYDRWYLLGHSQGSVLAFNALQETEWCLPNYLTQAHTQRLRPGPLWTRKPYHPDPNPKILPSEKPMMPRRPVWLDRHEGVSRERLFQSFQGFLTYGAPLDKFATLWPRIVCLNRQTSVFAKEADWVNLWDAADPIGHALSAFSDPNYAAPGGGPANVAVRANPLFLYSHICYLKPEDARAKRDTDALMEVVLSPAAKPLGLRAAFGRLPGAGNSQTDRRVLAWVQAALVGVLLALSAGGLALAVERVVAPLLGYLPEFLAAGLKQIGWLAAWKTGGYGGAVRFVLTFDFLIVLGLGFYQSEHERRAAAARKAGAHSAP